MLWLIAIALVNFPFVKSGGECICMKEDFSKPLDRTKKKPKKKWMPPDFETDDMIGCYEAKGKYPGVECVWSDPEEWLTHTKAVMYPVTPGHCVFTAIWAAVENNGIETKWDVHLWNDRAAEIDNIFKGLDKKWGYIPLHRPAKYGRKGGRKKGTGGDFTRPFSQIMLKQVGLNFGLLKGRTYTPKFDDRLFVMRKDDLALNLDYFKDMLSGTRKFENSHGKKKPMLALMIEVNVKPYYKGEVSNHMTVVVRKKGTGEYFYLDSNEPIRKLLDNGKSPPLTNVYEETPVSNNPKKKTKNWAQGYAVDWSLNLGKDINVVAQWLLDKIKIRPTSYDEDIREENYLNPDEIGGALSFLVIVEDKKAKKPWKSVIEHYTKMRNEEPPTIPFAKDVKHYAHVGEHNDIDIEEYTNEVNNDRESVRYGRYERYERHENGVLGTNEVIFSLYVIDLTLIGFLFCAFLCILGILGVMAGYWYSLYDHK